MPHAIFDPHGLAANPSPKPYAPVLSGTYGHGVVSGVNEDELTNALANGAKRMLFGRYSNELGSMMPPATNADVLMLVAESRLLHGTKAAARLAQAIHHRAHLTPEARPKLQLVLFELLTNAIEHGNLALTERRKSLLNHDDWFEDYHNELHAMLESPLGRIPVLVACRRIAGYLEIVIEDRGMGFSIRQVQGELMNPERPQGHGLGLVFALLENKVEFGYGGRRVTFRIPVRPQDDTGMVPNRSCARDKARLFVVDDSAASLIQTEKLLRAGGYQKVETCRNSQTALERMLATKPDLVLLDATMPHLDGYALCRQMKAEPRLADTQVIFLTATDKPKARTKAYQLGAVDFIQKPVEPDELLARVETHLLNAIMLKKLKQFSSRMETDLERARLFQHDLLPSAASIAGIAERHNLSIATMYQGCDSLAGDYWTVMELDQTHVAVCLVDFTGHGVIAALNTVQLHTLLSSQVQLTNPVAVALNLNRQLHKLLGNGSFATFIYGVLNTETGDFTYAGGGIPPVLIRQKNGGLIRLDCTGLPLGLAPDIEVLPRRTKLAAGDTLIALSDAITDAPHANGQRWGADGLERAMDRIPANKATEDIVDLLLESFYETVQLPVDDDLTLVALTYKVKK